MKKFLTILLAVFLIIQLFRPKQNKAEAPGSNNIAQVYGMPENVRALLQRACLDCHSNNTSYPWYAYVQPVSWWLDNHIKNGKRHLNFDEFGTYRIARQYHKLEETIDEIKEGEMPLSSYTLIHMDAKLTAAEQQVICNWAESVKAKIKATYPPDSLVMPKRK